MAIKTYGSIKFNGNGWLMEETAPFVCIRLKQLFPHIQKSSTAPFFFTKLPIMCFDIQWFISRYPMKISDEDQKMLDDGVLIYHDQQRSVEELFVPDYKPMLVGLINGHKARDYQLIAKELLEKKKRLLLGDEIGLGKTLSGILSATIPGSLPMLVVVQTHLPDQWRQEIEEFTNLDVHFVKVTKPYELPHADVYIFKYSCLSGWVDVLSTGQFKTCVFDEVQELRRTASNKYMAAKSISKAVTYCLGMSATPIYNYGDEIFNILNLINPGCLGKEYDFLREWTTPFGQNRHRVEDPISLGSYLKDNHLFLRRTRRDVGRELPQINRIVHYIDHDTKEAEDTIRLAKQIALRVLSGSFIERGRAARELDMFLRQQTGIAKARHAAAFVRLLIESGEAVVLAGWHRRVYEIWEEELRDLNPVFYTGAETGGKKNASFRKYLNGETNLFIISLRSGIGLDGLHKRGSIMVIGELDWSPKVHEQLIGRLNRDGQKDPVSAIFLVTEYGSDPMIIDLLSLKSSQSEGIVNPLGVIEQVGSDDSRIKKLAESFLNIKK